MTHDERLQWASEFGEYLKKEWPPLEGVARQKGTEWTMELQRAMERLIGLLMVWPFARDFCEKAQRYGDYAARAYRMPLYIGKVLQLVEREGDDALTALVAPAAVPAASPAGKKRKPGRPASEATIARREAEKKAAQMQVQMFAEASQSEKAVITESRHNEITPQGGESAANNTAAQPFLSPATRDDTEYRLSVAQIRAFLSPELQERADTIRTLRGQHAAASERAKTMSDMKADPKSIEPVAKEAIDAHDAYMAIYAAIDTELAVLWYRLQNDSDQWRTAWLQKYGFLKPNASAPSGSAASVLHPDLLHDLRKHYQKVQSPEFDLRCRTLIEQESPEYIARQKAEAEKKKEVQDILRYMKRKDKGISEQRVKTSREKFARLQELLGKKAAADYKPLLTKIEDDYKAAQAKQSTKTTVPDGTPSAPQKQETK